MWGTILWLHLLAMAFFVGGQLFLALAVVPVERRNPDRRWGDGTLQVKLALVALTAGLVVWHMRRPQNHAIESAILVFSVAIVALGVALAR